MHEKMMLFPFLVIVAHGSIQLFSFPPDDDVLCSNFLKYCKIYKAKALWAPLLHLIAPTTDGRTTPQPTTTEKLPSIAIKCRLIYQTGSGPELKNCIKSPAQSCYSHTNAPSLRFHSSLSYCTYSTYIQLEDIENASANFLSRPNVIFF